MRRGAGMRRWPYVNGIAGPRVLRVRRWAESLGARVPVRCKPARRTRNLGEAVYGITDTDTCVCMGVCGARKAKKLGGLGWALGEGWAAGCLCETRLRRQRWRGWCQLVIT